MLLRYVSSSWAAIVVTASLLLMMAALIAQQSGPRLSTRPAVFDTFVFDPPPPPDVARRERPEQPDPVDNPPPRIRTEGEVTDIPILTTRTGGYEPPTRFGGLRLGIADGDLLPIVTVAPTFPASAERRGLEGYVIVAFAVMPNGSVDNARIVESTHTVFERAAIDAVYKFRFRPRVIDGTPVAVDGVKRQITFTLED